MFWKKKSERPSFPEAFVPSFPLSPVAGLRPCEVDGVGAVFHRWADEEQALLKFNVFLRPDDAEAMYKRFQETGIVPYACAIEKVRTTRALVELATGQVVRVDPKHVKFLDREGEGCRE